MKGQNKIVKQNIDKPDLLINNIFKTIQGEGPLAGTPAIFVRTGDCCLKCFWCDTDFTTGNGPMSNVEVKDKILELINSDRINLVVFTGGEPLIHNLIPLMHLLRHREIHIQIETSGAVGLPGLRAFQDSGTNATIVCSPKTFSLNNDIVPLITHWKYIIKADEVSETDGLPIASTQSPGKRSILFRPPGLNYSDHRNIFVQPLDEDDYLKNKTNQEECIRIALKYGYRISLQTHKILELE